MQTLRTTPIVGLSKFEGWSQVWTDQSHSFVCAFSIQGTNANNVGKDVIASLETAQITTSEQLHSFLLQIQQRIQKKECHLSMTCLAKLNDTQCVLGVVQAKMYLKRGNKIGLLLSSSEETTIRIVKGKLYLDDVFMLITTQAAQFMEEIVIKFNKGYDVDTIISNTVPSVHGMSDSSLTAIAFVTVEPHVVETHQMDATESSEFDSQARTRKDSENQSSASLHSVELSDSFETGEKEEIFLAGQSEILSPVMVPDDSLSVKDGISPEESPSEKYFTDHTKKQAEQKDHSAGNQSSAEKKSLFASFLLLWSQIKKTVQKIPIQKMLSFLPQKKQEVYVGRASSRKIVRRIIPVIIILVLLFAGFMYMRVKKQRQEAEIKQVITPLAETYFLARETSKRDPILAREQVSDLLLELESLQKTHQKQKVLSERIKNFQQEVQSFYEDISGRQEFQELPVFFDLRLVDQDFLATHTELSGETLFFLDGERKKLISLDATTKEAEQIDVPVEGTIIDFVVTENNIYFLLESSIVRFDTDSAEARVVREDDEELLAASEITNFGNSLYVLNPSRRNIFKFTIEGTGYAAPQAWVRSAQGVDLSLAYTFTIDGDIWVTTTNGQIIKFRSGNREEFSLRGVSDPFSSRLKIDTYVDQDQTTLVLLEAEKHRIVVLNQDGEFQKEVKSSTLTTVNDLEFDGETSQVFLVSGSVVFRQKI